MRDAARAVPFAVAIVAGAAIAALPAQTAHQHPQPGTHPTGGAHRHPEAAKMTNPVHADATSIAAGKNLYDKHCAGCHGDTGKGDGSMGTELDPDRLISPPLSGNTDRPMVSFSLSSVMVPAERG